MNAQQTSTTILARVVIASTLLAVLVFLTACEGAGTPMTKKEEKPTLHGSWQRVETTVDDDGDTGVRTITLTFTKSRFIWYSFTKWDDGSSRRSESGTWTSTDNTVTKIDHWTEDEDGVAQFSEDLTSTMKTYEWGDPERNTLLIQSWEGDAVDDASLQRYTRLEPLTGGITGIWSGEEFAFQGDDDDVGFLELWTLTIGDGTFMAEVSTDPDMGSFSHSGDLRHDPEEGFLFVTVTNIEGSASVNDLINEGHELKYAYAQIGPSTIVVSRFNRERTPAGTMWVDLTGPHAFGSYWLLLEKQQ